MAMFIGSRREVTATPPAGYGLWLDAQDVLTLFTDAAMTTFASVGQTVRGWTDKSGSGYHATTTDPSYSYNGIPLANDGTFNYLALSGAASALRTSYVPATGTVARTLVIIHSNDLSTTALSHLLHYGTAGTGQSFGICNSGGQFVGGLYNRYANHYWLGGYASSESAISGVGVKKLIIVTFVSGVESWYANNVLVGTHSPSISTGSAFGIRIGARISLPTEFGRGRIFEIAAYPFALSELQRTQLWNYVRSKYFI